MVQALVNVSEKANRVLNILKAQHGLRDKSEAINMMAEIYEKELMELELRPEYVKKAKRIMKQKAIEVGTVADLRKRYATE
jgi:hypothetical protein